MSGTDTAFVTFARATSTLGCGLYAGLALSIPLWSFPSLYSVQTLSPRDRLHFTLRTYARGKATVPPLSIASALLAGYASIVAKAPANYLPSNFISRHRKAFLLASVAATLFSPVYTALVMLPNIKTMHKVEQEIEASAESGGAEKYDVDDMIQRWLGQHLLRTAFGIVAFGCSVLELANA